MASPAVATTSEGASTTAGTSHTVTFPTGSTTGDLIFIFIVGNSVSFSNSESFVNPGGFGQLWYKQLDGSEGADTVMTSGGSSRTSWIALRITGHINPATQVPEATTGSATGLTPNPGSLAPTGGSKDYLFIVAYLVAANEEADDDTWANSSPTNYLPTPPLQKTCGTAGAATANNYLAVCSRQVTTSSEDPGTMSVDIDGGGASGIFTVAIHPAAATFAPVLRKGAIPKVRGMVDYDPWSLTGWV